MPDTMPRLAVPAPGDPSTERVLHFFIRYDWETRDVQFVRVADSDPSIVASLGPDETVQRCEVLLHRPAPEHAVPAEQVCLEVDHVDWDKMTVSEAMRRLHPLALFPVLPIAREGNRSTVPIHTRHDRSEDGRRESQTLSFQGRRFRVTVEELDPDVA